MKKFFLLLTIITVGLAAALPARAADDREILDGFMQYIPESDMPDGYRAAARAPVYYQGVRMDPTLALLRVVRNWDNLQPETREILSRYIDISPPRNGIRTVNSVASKGCSEVLSESSDLTADSEHFRIIYTNSGTHQTSTSYVNSIKTAAEYVWDTETSTIGLPPPKLPSDNKIRIYLCDLLGSASGLLGRTWTTSVNDNNHTAQTYIELDNDYAGFNMPSTIAEDSDAEEQYAAVVLAHEFFHAIQFGINYVAPSYWLLESNAVWIEEEVYPDIDDYITSYVSGRFRNLDVSIDYFSFDDVLGYGAAIFFRHITENELDDTFITDLWDGVESGCLNLSSNSWCQESVTEIPLVSSLLAADGKSLDTVYRNFNVANYTKDYHDGTKDYFPDVTSTNTDVSSGSVTKTGDLDHLAADFYTIYDSTGEPDPAIVIQFQGSSGADWEFSVVKKLSPTTFSTTNATISSNGYTGVFTGFGTDFSQATLIVNNVHTSSDDASYTLNMSYTPYSSTPKTTLSNRTVSSGSSGIAAHLAKLTSPSSGTLESIYYSNAGSGSLNDPVVWKLYRDADGNGAVGGSDTLLGTVSTTGSSGPRFTNLSNNSITAGQPYYYLLTLDIGSAVARTAGEAGFGAGIIAAVALLVAVSAGVRRKNFRAKLRLLILAAALAAVPLISISCGGGSSPAPVPATTTLRITLDSSNISIKDSQGDPVTVSGETVSGPEIKVR